MEQVHNTIKNLIELMGFEDFSINIESETRRLSIFINDNDDLKKFLPQFVNSLDCLVRIISQKDNAAASVFIDINNYRREREGLILELTRAAARKSAAEKKEISLPPMNAYERRLIHLELSQRPDLKTESVGEGKERYVIIKPL
ncbi:MAG: R3H domain-containing nucleic acid-binding protein [Patescibacteria group bacterium]